MSIIVESTIRSIQARLDAELTPSDPYGVVSVFLDPANQPGLTAIDRHEILDHFISVGYHCTFSAPSMRLDVSQIIHRPGRNISTIAQRAEFISIINVTSNTPYERDELIRLIHSDGRDPHFSIEKSSIYILNSSKEDHTDE